MEDLPHHNRDVIYNDVYSTNSARSESKIFKILLAHC